MKTFEIAVFHGDGIGPDVMAPTLDILRRMAQASPGYALAFTDAPAGAAHYAKTGESLPAASLEIARNADAILLSAMGLPGIRYPDGRSASAWSFRSSPGSGRCESSRVTRVR